MHSLHAALLCLTLLCVSVMYFLLSSNTSSRHKLAGAPFKMLPAEYMNKTQFHHGRFNGSNNIIIPSSSTSSSSTSRPSTTATSSNKLTTSSKRSSKMKCSTQKVKFSISQDVLNTVRSVAASVTGTSSSVAKKRMSTRTEPLIDMSGVTYHTHKGRQLTQEQILSDTCDPDYPVPNIIHYVLPFVDASISFHHLVCILSGFWVVRPQKVIFWYSKKMQGPHWDALVKNITEERFESWVVMAHRTPPTKIYDASIGGKEHQADVIRMEAILTFGGIYLDLDVISLKPFEPLRKYNLTLGRETGYGLCNGIIFASRNSYFMVLWHLAYQLMRDHQWAHLSVMFPHSLNAKLPGHCHVEEESLDRPNWTDGERIWIYGKERKWDWQKKNYAMHLWYRFHHKQYDMESIKRVDSMLGDMFRYVLFGNPKMSVT